jgi:flagellar biogenesis protein FliO
MLRCFAVDADSPLFQQGSAASASSVKTAPARDGASSAASPLALPEEKPQPAPSFLATFVKMLLALALTVGLLLLALWGLKQIMGKQGASGKQAGERPLKILASTYLAPRKTIHLVEVGKRILVVGSGNDEVTSLGVITDPEEMEMIRKLSHSEGGFTDVLRKAWSRQETGKSREDASRLAEEGRVAIGGWVDKLRDLSKKSGSGPGTGGGGE